LHQGALMAKENKQQTNNRRTSWWFLLGVRQLSDKIKRTADVRPHLDRPNHNDKPKGIVMAALCSLGCEGIVSKRRGSPYRAGRADCWLKVKNPAAPAVTREAEEDWG
jgi:ATP-dependent DNA ligase